MHLPFAVGPHLDVLPRKASEDLCVCGPASYQWHVWMITGALLVEFLPDTSAARQKSCWFLYQSSLPILGRDVGRHSESAHVALD